MAGEISQITHMFLFLCIYLYDFTYYAFVDFLGFTITIFSVYTHLEGQVQKALERKYGFRHFDTNITVTTTAEMFFLERGCWGIAFRECPIHLVCQTRHRGSPWPGHLILLIRALCCLSLLYIHGASPWQGGLVSVCAWRILQHSWVDGRHWDFLGDNSVTTSCVFEFFDRDV